jgi:hypothetical protein
MEFNVEDRVKVSGELFADRKARDFVVGKIMNGILYLHTPDLQSSATQGSALYYELSEVEPDGMDLIEMQLPMGFASKFLSKEGGRRRRRSTRTRSRKSRKSSSSRRRRY